MFHYRPKIAQVVVNFFTVLLLFALLVPTLLFFAVQHPQVQTYLVQETTKALSQKLNTKVSVESIHFRLFNRLLVKKVYLQDLTGDTLTYAASLDLSIRHINLQQRQIGIGTLAIEDFQMHLVRDSVKVVNLRKVFQGLSKPSGGDSVDTVPVESRPFSLQVKHVILKNASFVLDDYSNYIPQPPTVINYYDLDVKKLSCSISNISMCGDTMLCSLDALALQEKSGFHLRRLSGKVSIAPNFIELKELILIDDYSDIRADFYRMDFESFSEFPNYIENVRMSAHLRNAKVDFYTIGFFAPKLKRFHLPVYVTGFAGGTVSNLRGKDLDIRAGKNSYTDVGFSMRGIPDVPNTFFTFDVRKIYASSQDLLLFDSLLIKPHAYQRMIKQLEYIDGHARFTGFFSSFVTEGKVATSKGEVVADLSFTPTIDTAVEVRGSLGTNNFDMGGLLNDSILGRLSFFGQVNGSIHSLRHFELNTDVKVPQIELNQYLYNDVTARGTLTEHSFKGDLQCKDENLLLSFIGRVYFERDKKAEFDFNLGVEYAHLSNLKWVRHDSTVVFNGRLLAAGTGLSIDSFIGHLELINATCAFGSQSFNTKLLVLDATQTGGWHNLSLLSDIADLRLQAMGGLSRLPHTAKMIAKYYVPAWEISSDSLLHLDGAQTQQYVFSAKIKAPLQNIIATINPQVRVADSTQLQGVISSDFAHLQLAVQAPYLHFQKNDFRGLKFNLLTAADSTLNLNLQTSEFNVSTQKLSDVSLNATLHEGQAKITSNYALNAKRGTLNTQASIFKSTDGSNTLGLEFNLDTSKVFLGDTLFYINPSRISIEKNNIAINNFRLFNTQQEFSVNGIMSSKLSDTLRVDFSNLSVAPIFRAINEEVDVSGDAFGKVKIYGGLSSAPVFLGNLKIANAFFMQDSVGDITLNSFSGDDDKDVMIDVKIERNNKELLHIDSYLKANGELTAKADLRGLETVYLNSLLGSTLSDISGTLHGDLQATGALRNIMLNGKLELEDARLRVNMLNSVFKVSTPLTVENSTISIKKALAYDDKGNQANLDFTLSNLTTPAQLRYDLKVEPKKLHVLNCTEWQNELFYGQAYTSGTVHIQGSSNEIDVSVVADIDANTQLSIPLAGTQATQASGFINFVSDEAKSRVVSSQKSESDVKLDLNFKVTPEADIMLVLNRNTGDVIKANGNGSIRIESQSNKDILRLFGDYNITQGEYSVSLQNIINIKFKISAGSTINFNGDLAATTANIEATHRMRAPLAGLFADADSSGRYNRSVPIECKVRITNRLTAPDVQFIIDAPTVDNETRDRMQAQLSAEDNHLTQFLSLVLIGQFFNTSALSNLGQSVGGLTVNELLASQLTSLISQFADINVGVNINQAVDGATGPDWGVSLSTNITDRVLLSGSFEYQSQRRQLNPNSSEYFGDVDVEVLLDKSGKLRLKAFSHGNDQYTEMVTGVNRFGVGLVYQEDFDTFSDLWTSVIKRLQQNAKRKPKEKQPSK
ncbi:MAG: hypothetical protein ACRCY6_05525 [Bacteroidales bacterium]